MIYWLGHPMECLCSPFGFYGGVFGGVCDLLYKLLVSCCLVSVDGGMYSW